MTRMVKQTDLKNNKEVKTVYCRKEYTFTTQIYYYKENSTIEEMKGSEIIAFNINDAINNHNIAINMAKGVE